MFETAKHDAEDELYRRNEQQLHPNASLMIHPQLMIKTINRVQPHQVFSQQAAHPANQVNVTHANNVAAGTTCLNLSQLAPVQLLALQQQGARSTALPNSILPHPLLINSVQQQPQQRPIFPTIAPLVTLPLTIPHRPVYNGVNPNYPGLRVVNRNPPMFAVDQFLTPTECQFLIHNAHDSFGPAPVVGKGSGEISQARTSSTCYLAREDLPNLMRKICVLTGKPFEHCELPQVGRYFATQQYLQHFDAFDLDTEDGVSAFCC
jgi:hypothetical protein